MKLNFSQLKTNLKTAVRTASVSISIAALVCAILGLGALYYLTSTLPDVNKLKTFHHVQTSEVYSDEGRKIGEFTTERRYPLVFNSLPKYVIQAFLAAEDSKFYEHHGVDFTGIGRAIFSNISRARFAQGGSTTTQQVARALLLGTKKKEITRKIREIVLASTIAALKVTVVSKRLTFFWPSYPLPNTFFFRITPSQTNTITS